MKKKIIARKEYVAITRGRKIMSSRSRTRGILLSQYLFMTCASAIKQTSDCLFLVSILHLFCYIKNYFKAVLSVPAKRSVN